tara:strand:- start:279 stop:479 length:201 start_codon:yes stop_codon:yes gene_type:complete
MQYECHPPIPLHAHSIRSVHGEKFTIEKLTSQITEIENLTLSLTEEGHKKSGRLLVRSFVSEGVRP